MLIVLDFIWIISKSAAKIQQIPETHVHFRNLFYYLCAFNRIYGFLHLYNNVIGFLHTSILFLP